MSCQPPDPQHKEPTQAEYERVEAVGVEVVRRLQELVGDDDHWELVGVLCDTRSRATVPFGNVLDMEHAAQLLALATVQVKAAADAGADPRNVVDLDGPPQEGDANAAGDAVPDNIH